jgi:hypothetical protein
VAILNSQIRINSPNPQPDQALIAIELHVPDALARVLASTGKPVPAPIVGMAIIDTGASVSCVDEQSMIGLGVFPIGVQSVGGVAGINQHPVFPARLAFPQGAANFAFDQLVGVDLQSQSRSGLRILALIGRDILSRCVLVYNGAAGIVTLGF